LSLSVSCLDLFIISELTSGFDIELSELCSFDSASLVASLLGVSSFVGASLVASLLGASSFVGASLVASLLGASSFVGASLALLSATFSVVFDF